MRTRSVYRQPAGPHERAPSARRLATVRTPRASFHERVFPTDTSAPCSVRHTDTLRCERRLVPVGERGGRIDASSAVWQRAELLPGRGGDVAASDGHGG